MFAVWDFVVRIFARKTYANYSQLSAMKIYVINIICSCNYTTSSNINLIALKNLQNIKFLIQINSINGGIRA